MAGRGGTRRLAHREPIAWWTVGVLGLASLLVVGLLGVVISQYASNAEAGRVRLVAHDGIPLLTDAPVTETGLSGSFTGSRDVRSDIEQQVVNAMVLEQRMQITPTPATTRAAQSKAVALFPLIFTPAHAAREGAVLEQANRFGDGIHLVDRPTSRSGSKGATATTTSASVTSSVVDGGIDWARFGSVTAHGTTAVATGQVRTWLKSGRDAGGRVIRPTNTLTVYVTLRLVSGRWLVDTIHWSFAPGGEP